MIERWLSSNRHIEIEHDGHFVLGGEKHGQPIEAVRQKTYSGRSRSTNPFKLRQHFLQRGNFQDAEKVEQVDGMIFQGTRGRLLAEVNFASTSF